MEVSLGWNTEFGRDRFIITLGPADLCRILGEHGFPVEAADKALKSPQVFEILRWEAQMLAEYAKLNLLVKDSDPWKSVVAQTKVYLSRRDDALTKLRTEMGLDGQN